MTELEKEAGMYWLRCNAVHSDPKEIEIAYKTGFRKAKQLLVTQAEEGWIEYIYNSINNQYIPKLTHKGTVHINDIKELWEKETNERTR